MIGFYQTQCMSTWNIVYIVCVYMYLGVEVAGVVVVVKIDMKNRESLVEDSTGMDSERNAWISPDNEGKNWHSWQWDYCMKP